jgi:hypothetical protein
LVDGVPVAAVVPLCASFSSNEATIGESSISLEQPLMRQLRLFGSLSGLINMTIFLFTMNFLAALFVSSSNARPVADAEGQGCSAI